MLLCCYAVIRGCDSDRAAITAVLLSPRQQTGPSPPSTVATSNPPPPPRQQTGPSPPSTIATSTPPPPPPGQQTEIAITII